MLNINEYFKIDWEATADNIRSYMRINSISSEALAKAMYTNKRNIENWCRNHSRPSTEELVILSKIFNVDLLDIIVLMAQTDKSKMITKNDLEDAEIKANKSKETTSIKGEYYLSKEEIEHNTIFNEYLKSEYEVTNLYEFICIIPFVEPELLADSICRIIGNGLKDKKYVMKQLNQLYKTIHNEDYIKYIKFIKKYICTYPNINEIDDETEVKLKNEKI